MNKTVIESIVFTIPIVCALMCMVLVLMDASARRRNKQEMGLRLFLALTYAVTSLGWLGIVFYFADSRLFESYKMVFLLTLMFDQVMIYRFVCIITGTDGQHEFHPMHLFVPLVFAVISLEWDIMVPLFVVYNAVYPLLNVLRIKRYREFVVDYSSDASRTSLRWLYIIQILILITIPLPLAMILLDSEISQFGYWPCLGALPYFINYLILCYNLLNNNYLIVPTEDEAGKNEYWSEVLSRRQFDEYLMKKKPWLNPNLRVTDIAAELHTNRCYLSSFIKKEYNMNFCRLINQYRLQELDRLRLSSLIGEVPNIELVMMSGFANYRSYLRAKKEEDKLNLLKMFDLKG